MTTHENKVKTAWFILFFNILWLARVFLVPKTPSEAMNFAISVLLKCLIFVVFPALYIRFSYKESPLAVFKLKGNVGKGIRYGLVASAVVGILGVLVYVLAKGTIHLQGLALKDVFVAFIFAGFMEEVAFRGIILGKLSQLMSFKKASLCTALLFTWLHMPQAIANGTILSQAVVGSLFIVLLWGLADNALVQKSNSLWGAIIVHGVWDCAVHVLGF